MQNININSVLCIYRSQIPKPALLHKLLNSMKGFHGTVFNPLGYTAKRRVEQRLIADYRSLINDIVDRLDQSNRVVAIEIARAAGEISGYGPVKDAAIVQYESVLKGLLTRFLTASLHA